MHNNNTTAGTKIVHGISLTILGIVLYCLAHYQTGTGFEEFAAGVLLGVSVSAMLVGAIVTMVGVVSDCYPAGCDLKSRKK